MGWVALAGLTLLAMVGAAYAFACLRARGRVEPAPCVGELALDAPIAALGSESRSQSARRAPRLARVHVIGPLQAHANDAEPLLGHQDIHEIEACLAKARIAVDDLWFAAEDAASRKPFTPRAFWRRDVHRRGFLILQHLRAAQDELDRLRSRIECRSAPLRSRRAP